MNLSDLAMEMSMTELPNRRGGSKPAILSQDEIAERRAAKAAYKQAWQEAKRAKSGAAREAKPGRFLEARADERRKVLDACAALEAEGKTMTGFSVARAAGLNLERTRETIRALKRDRAWPYRLRGNAARQSDSRQRIDAVLAVAADLVARGEPITYARLVEITGYSKENVWHYVDDLRRADRWPYTIEVRHPRIGDGNGRQDDDDLVPADLDQLSAGIRDAGRSERGATKANGERDDPTSLLPPRSYAVTAPKPEPTLAEICQGLLAENETLRELVRTMAEKANRGEPVLGECKFYAMPMFRPMPSTTNFIYPKKRVGLARWAPRLPNSEN